MIEFITRLDFSILNFIYEYIRCDFLDPIMEAITTFADAGIGWIVLALALLIPKKTRVWGAMALLALLLSLLLGELVLKNIFCRIRPYDAYEAFFNSPLPFVLNSGTESSFSFPSGHTSCSFASATIYFMGNKKWGIVALVFAFLVGFSRMYNYVHYPTDVLGGMILGILCGLAIFGIFKKSQLLEKINGKIE